MERLNVFTQTPIGKFLKLFLSGTRRPRSLIFGMSLYLVDLYQHTRMFLGINRININSIGLKWLIDIYFALAC